MKIFVFCAIICYFTLAQGAPSIKRTPCWDRSEQVQLDIASTGRIVNEPTYVPECESDGVLWKHAQCSHQDIGYCFCVDPNTGVPREETRSYLQSKESLNCIPSEEPSEDFSVCQLQQQAYNLFLEQWPTVVDIPFQYQPICAEDHSFVALQRNSLSFFCVDITTGDIIPGTTQQFEQENRTPLHENVCQSYSDIWQEYVSLVTLFNLETDETNHMLPWTAFLEENADDVLRRFWHSETTSVEMQGNGIAIEEPEVEPDSNEDIVPEEVEETDTEHQQEVYEYQEYAYYPFEQYTYTEEETTTENETENPSSETSSSENLNSQNSNRYLSGDSTEASEPENPSNIDARSLSPQSARLEDNEESVVLKKSSV